MRPVPALADDFEMLGYWWLPGIPDRKVPGRLGRKNQRLELLVLDQLVERTLAERGVIGPTPRFELIHGWLDDGRACTLLDSVDVGGTFHSSGFETSRIRVGFLMLGHHFANRHEIAFAEVAVAQSHMESWLRWNPFETEQPVHDGTRVTGRARFESFPTRTYPVAGVGATVALESWISFRRSLQQHEWQHSVRLKLALAGDRSLEKYLEVLTDCRNLFTLFTGRTVVATGVVGFLDPDPGVPDVGPREVPVFFAQRAELFQETGTPEEILVTYPHVEGVLNRVFENWLTKAESLRTVTELYFGTLYNRSMYLRFHLLSLAQALESYSRAFLHPRDNKSFRVRVEGILDSVSPGTASLICHDKPYFAEVVAETRDYFTHYLDKHRGKAPDGPDLHMLTERVRVLLRILLLKEAGVDEGLVGQLVRDHPNLMQWFRPHPARPAAAAP